MVVLLCGSKELMYPKYSVLWLACIKGSTDVGDVIIIIFIIIGNTIGCIFPMK